MFTYVLQSFGILGAVFVILGYYLTVSGRWEVQSKKFLKLNLFAATLLALSLIENPNIGSIMIEIFWILISIKGLKQLKNS
jgi:uncharacterized protein (DUF983 family)